MTLRGYAGLLAKNGVGVIPTDTLYGLVGRAQDREVIERIYRLKGRQPNKPLIILISSFEDLSKFKVKADAKTKKVLEKYWPGKVSVILPCPNQEFEYLHRGTKTLAFRLPDYPELIHLITQTGPLAAPSANPEGLPPAKNIKEAREYFGNEVDFYYTKGILKSPPSTLIEVRGGKIKVLREGAVKIKS